MEWLETSNDTEQKTKKQTEGKCTCNKKLVFIEKEIEKIKAEISLLKKTIRGK